MISSARILAVLMFALASSAAAAESVTEEGGRAVWQDGHRSAFGRRELDRYLITGAFPDYPYEARLSRLVGKGQYELQVARAGAVTKVVVLKSSGVRMLDQAAVTAFGAWRFKPGIFQRIQIPVIWEKPRVTR